MFSLSLKLIYLSFFCGYGAWLPSKGGEFWPLTRQAVTLSPLPISSLVVPRLLLGRVTLSLWRNTSVGVAVYGWAHRTDTLLEWNNGARKQQQKEPCSVFDLSWGSWLSWPLSTHLLHHSLQPCTFTLLCAPEIPLSRSFSWSFSWTQEGVVCPRYFK